MKTLWWRGVVQNVGEIGDVLGSWARATQQEAMRTCVHRSFHMQYCTQRKKAVCPLRQEEFKKPKT
jgi:hypothetical protein